MVNHKPSIVYQTAGLSYKKGFSIKVNGVSEKNSSPRHLDCSYILYIVSTNAIELWLCAGAYIHSSAQFSGNQEVPPNNSAAKGRAWFIQTGNTIWYKLNVTGLDKIMGAHIHNGKIGQIGDPIVTLFHSGTP